MTNAHHKQSSLGGPIGPISLIGRMTCPRLTGLVVFFAALVFAAPARAQLGHDLRIDIEPRFLTINDNFFERIGVDFDFNIEDDQDDSLFGFVETNNQPGTTLDLPVEIVQLRLISSGAEFPDPAVSGPAEVGGSISLVTDSELDSIPLTSLGFDFRSGITAPPGTAGRVQNQGVVALKLNIPPNVTGDLAFEVETSFDADIVEPLLGKFALGALIELSTNISEFRFFGSSQRFFFESDSLGPFGDLYSTANAFMTDMGVLQFRGENTVPFMIDQADIEAEQVFLQVYSDIFLRNFGTTAAQVDATQTVSFTLRSLTPGVTFQKSLVVPEPETLQLALLAAAAGYFWGRQRKKPTAR